MSASALKSGRTKVAVAIVAVASLLAALVAMQSSRRQPGQPEVKIVGYLTYTEVSKNGSVMIWVSEQPPTPTGVSMTGDQLYRSITTAALDTTAVRCMFEKPPLGYADLRHGQLVAVAGQLVSPQDAKDPRICAVMNKCRLYNPRRPRPDTSPRSGAAN